jgi:trk system potassium uptake protein TrkH
VWIRLRKSDLAIIVHYTGLFVVGIGLAMLIPLVTAVVMSEWAPATHYLCGMGVALVLGMLMVLVDTGNRRITHQHALMIAAFSWFAAAVVAAVPLALSHNYPTYIDAAFDAISGLTTSGLTVVTNLDHMAYSHNMWRHLTHLIGGQGIIVAALSLAIGLRGGAFALYLAEGRDEKVMPNVVNTARFIWFVTGVYLLLGTGVLFAHNLIRGMVAPRAFLHAFWIFIAAYDTGGFAPQSMNALYYHSWVFEAITITLMMAGTLNFNLHAAVWRGNRREMFKNIETRTLALSILAISALVGIGLAREGIFGGPLETLRKGAYHVLSAHTGTGHQTLYASQWAGQFSEMALIGIMLAMALGGAVSSTAGGIKALRVGLLFKTIVRNVRAAVSPKSVLVQTRYHHIRDKILSPEMAGTVLIFFTTYVLAYITGGIIGTAYGYPMDTAMFESISATANVGLSMGITGPDMEIGLKLLYMFQMWIGRLEFVAVFALVGHLINAVRTRSSGDD